MNVHVRKTAVPETHVDDLQDIPPAQSWDQLVAALNAAWTDLGLKDSALDEVVMGRDQTEDEADIISAADEAVARTTQAIRDYQPRTLEEFADQAVLLTSHEAFIGCTAGEPQLVQRLGTLREATQQWTGLQALEPEFDRLWAIEQTVCDGGGTDADLDAASEAAGAVGYKIMDLPARTVDDFRIKAKMVGWAAGGIEELIILDEKKSASEKFCLRLLQELLAFQPSASQQSADRSEWEDLIADRDAAHAISRADVDDDDLADGYYQKFKAVREAVPPDFAALMEKFRQAFSTEQYTGESMDDAIVKALDGGEQFEHAISYIDLQTILRRAGHRIELEPRAFNKRLEDVGCTVSAVGFSNLTNDAMAMLEVLQVDQPFQLMAASWIDAMVEEGGSICQWSEGPFFGCPVPTPEPLQLLLDQIDRKTGKGELRLAVAALAQQQMKERGTLIIAASDERRAEIADAMEAARAAEDAGQ